MKNSLLRCLDEHHRQGMLFCLLSVVFLAFGVQGFEHGRVNHFRDQSIQLPIIYSYADPTLFGGDFLLKARDSYVTLFYPVIGVLSRFIPLVLLMLGLYLATVCLTVTAVYTLAETLFPANNVGLFAVFLWMAYLPNPGGDFIHAPFVTHSTFAISTVLWALVLILRRKYSWAALLLGLAANINAMTSFFVMFMWLFTLVLNWREWSWHLLRLPVIMGLISAPILLWRFSLPLVETSLDHFVEIVRLRLWYAVFPLSTSVTLWIGFLGLLLLWWYSFRYGRPQQHPQVLRMAASIALLSILGGVFSEIVPVEFIIELQLIRSTWLINLFMMLYLANMLRQQLGKGSIAEVGVAFALAAVLTAPRLVLELMPMTQPTPYTLFVDLDAPGTQAHIRLLILPFGILSLGLLFIIWRLTHHTASPAANWRMMAWFGFAMICFLLPLFLNNHLPAGQVSTTADWEKTLLWVEKNAPRHARFITPPTLDGFRVTARRAQLGDWKDGTIGIFNNGWAIEWYDLMVELGFDRNTFSFKPMSQNQLCRIMDKYHLDYAIVFQSWQIAGESVYENKTFAVIPVDSLDCALTLRYNTNTLTQLEKQ